MKRSALNKKRVLVLVCISFATLAFFAIPKTKASKNITYDAKYYTGDYKSINYIANMIDNINKEDILISPFNINSSLASLYSINYDNNLNKIFKEDPSSVDYYYLSKMSKYKYITKEKNKREIYYESLINKLYEKKYDKLDIYSFSKIGNIDKESIILLLTKIEMINSKSSIKQIKKYKLTNKDKSISNQTILNKIKDIIYNYELYQNPNYIINTTNYYYDNKINNIKDVKDKYLVNINKTNIDEDSIKQINKDILTNTNNKINYIINEEVLDKKLVITSSLVFNYKWEDIISEKQNTYKDFYIEDKIITTEMLTFHSNNILENYNAYGFIKDYENKNYSFIGILPKYNNNLSSINIEKLLQSKSYTSINISIPLFKITDKNIINNNNYYLSHKTSFTLTNSGTTNINTKNLELENHATLIDVNDLVFDKPFYFIILDNNNNVVLLAGKITNPSL